MIWLLMASLSYGAERYTMEDLNILAAQKGHQEFFARAKDIPPRARDKRWQKLVRSMAVELVDLKLQQRDFSKDTSRLIRSLGGWPSLRQDSFFQRKRGEYTLQQFRLCVRGRKKTCLEKLESYRLESPHISSVSYSMAKEIARHDLGIDLWPYLAKIAQSADSGPWCGQKLFARRALRELHKRGALEENPARLVRLVDRTLHSNCWAAVKDKFKTALLDKEGPPGPMEDLLFRLLDAKGALTPEEENFYLTLFILKGPVVGETFNRAWSRLKKLGENWPARQKVLGRLLRRPLLPAGFLTTADEEKRRTLLRFIAGHFPEYLNAYAKACLKYFEGKAPVPSGQCHHFFQASKKEKVLSDRLQIRYSGLKKGRR